MLLNAVCPHCQDAELQIPAELSGTAVTCRRCGKPFLFQPAAPRSAFDPEPTAKRAKAANKPAGGTATAAKLSDTAPAAVAPISPVPAVAATPPAADTVPADPPDHAFTLALVGVCLFGPALLVTQFPYGRIAAVPMLLAGLACAAVGLPGLEVKRWAGWLGVGANALGLLLVVLLPDWLGGPTWLPKRFETAEFKAPMAVSRDGPAKPVEWVEAGKASWQMGDVRAAVTAAVIETPAKGAIGNPSFRVTVQLSNVGLERTIEFPGWTAATPAAGGEPAPAPKLTAADGGQPVPLKPGGPPEPPHGIHPGKSLDTTLLFAAPPAKGDLRLELPAQPFGGKEPVKFQIPWAFVARQNAPPAKQPATP